MRYFNTYGPVNEKEHYIVPRRELLDMLTEQVSAGSYFTVFAPRQMGKTTLLRQLTERLQAQSNYLVVVLNFQDYADWETPDFLLDIGAEIGEKIIEYLAAGAHAQRGAVQEMVAQSRFDRYGGLRAFLKRFHKLAPEIRLVLIIDEFDGTPPRAISPLLQTLRKLYLEAEPPRSLHSAVLVGLRNIAALNLGQSSPFNIARQLNLPGFSEDEVDALLAQYTAERGQAFAPGVSAEIYRQTAGHPFLVNRLADILTEQVALNRAQPISGADLEQALRRMTTESNYNFETIVRHANPHKATVLRIMAGVDYEFNLNNPVVRELHEQGVIEARPDGACRIANPIYQVVLFAAFRPIEAGIQGAAVANGYDFRPHVVDGRLQMDVILSRFRAFVERRGRAAFKISETPQEATGQYLLAAYLDLLVRQVGGEVFAEVPSGAGRLDVIVVFNGQRYVIETKLWRGPAAFDASVTQVQSYLRSEGQTTGYLVVFHARPAIYGRLPEGELEFVREDEGVTIHVYLVRLG
ncbi:AAA-like domain-containing protein [Candidatus Amarolinea dominans]|uniref:AAA family ATPase n=1 Tax=Candidatus Amarolinea dominans TaxID=3140696 RepID=UPI0031365D10|nr:AAA-like domain-containing protein [Anaerolineae bacterium]